MSAVLRRRSESMSGMLPALACGAMRQVAAVGPLSNRLSILIYHRVLAEPDPLFPDEIDARRLPDLR